MNAARPIYTLAALVLFVGCQEDGRSEGQLIEITDTSISSARSDASVQLIGPDTNVDAGSAHSDQGILTDGSTMDPRALLDDDGDGLNNGDELVAGTDPNNPDSDGDGYSDGDEQHAGTEPLNADSVIYKGGWPYNRDKDELPMGDWGAVPSEGELMPRYTTFDQYGDQFDLYDLAGHGKRVVFDVGTWFCTPCKAMAQYFSDGDISHMDEFGWWNPRYEPVLDMINNDEIIWVTVLFSGSVPVTQEDVTRWHDTFPHPKIIVLGDPDLQLREYLAVQAMPHIDVLDENLRFLVYETRGPTSGMRHLAGIE